MSAIAQFAPETQMHERQYTRSRRPRQKSYTEGNGTARLHPTNSTPSSSRFKSGKQMNGIFRDHERDLWTREARRNQPVLRMCQLVWLVQRYHSIYCCGAGCPTSTAGGIMRTLQANVDLTDDGDKVIFRQFGGESSLRTLQSGNTVIRADQFDPDDWQLPEITELCQNNDEGFATNYMSVIAHVYKRPRRMGRRYTSRRP